jgi:branched-chain amino acid transport system permease protein
MHNFLIYTVSGLVIGAIYAISATGLVVTYVTSRVFNFAHGAVGMVVAFLYYALRVSVGVPEIPALAVSLLVIAPLMGVILDVALMRPLQRAQVAVRLMVTLALFAFLTGTAVLVWGDAARSLPPLISSGTFSPVSGLYVTWDDLAIVVVAVLVAAGLGLFLRRSRLGATMRAVVDDRTLAEMNGINTARVTSFSWALGCSLAGLAAILVAPSITLNIDALSILVVSTYAAAIVGRLASLPLTFAGAIGLGLLASYVVGYLPSTNQVVQGLGPAMPFIVLLVALILLRSDRSSAFEKVNAFPEAAPPRLRTTLVVGVAIVAVTLAVSPALDDFESLVVGMGLVYACILLSLVLITGMSGQVSLAQLSFAGLSAVLLPHLSGHMPYLLAVLVAVAAATAGGALMALPALRLRGLYLALSTLAFAVMMDNIFFPDTHLIPAATGSILIPFPGIAGHSLTTVRSLLWLIALVMAAYMIIVYAIRRSRFGFALAAMRDSSAAASALGLNLVRTKVTVFALSAGLAGLAGCLYGAVLGQVGAGQFNYTTSMTALLILAIYGLSSVPGAIIGAIFYVVLYQLLPVWITSTTVVEGLQPVFIALGVLNLVAHPEGVLAQNRTQINALLARRRASRAELGGPSRPARSESSLAEATNERSMP